MRRVLVTGWPSFVHGEATAGDVLAMESVAGRLRSHGVPADTAWSPRFRPGGLCLSDASPSRYGTVVFTCGPLHGDQVADLHRRFAECRRIAVGVSVIDPEDPAVTGFDAILPRDAPRPPPNAWRTPPGEAGASAPLEPRTSRRGTARIQGRSEVDTPGRRDLSAGVRSKDVPVVGVIPAPGQAEYGERRRHERVRDQPTAWVAGQDCAPVPLDTRLDADDWRMCTTPAQFESVLRRLDLVVTTRLHGLVLALKNGVPVLAADPVAGGAKVTAQAAAWDWPVLTCTGASEPIPEGDLRDLGAWCLTPEARATARHRAASPPPSLLTELLTALEDAR